MKEIIKITARIDAITHKIMDMEYIHATFYIVVRKRDLLSVVIFRFKVFLYRHTAWHTSALEFHESEAEFYFETNIKCFSYFSYYILKSLFLEFFYIIVFNLYIYNGVIFKSIYIYCILLSAAFMCTHYVRNPFSAIN